MEHRTHRTPLPRGAQTAERSRRLFAYVLAVLSGAHLSLASAQFKLQQTFEDTTAPGWTLSGSALLTAPSIDPAGQGWLRLTNTGNNEKGLTLDTSQTFAGDVPVTVSFRYVSWGGTGADGITVFLYDSTQNMAGATTGGGLGYCGGAGGYFAIGLDEYGNFSNPADHCTGGGGPGRVRESLVLRGPLSAHDEYVAGLSVTGGIDDPGVTTRTSPKTVIVTLTPAAVGYTITAQFQSAAGAPFQTLFTNVAFPYAPPASLSVGFSGSTGGSTNYHELQGLAAASPDDLQVTMTGPATVLEGAPVTYMVTVTNNGVYAIDAADAPLVTDVLPATILGTAWTCTPSAGATCAPSGAGDLSTSALTLPSNGSVTYAVTGTLAPGTACGGLVTSSANADFGSSSTFLDPDETNNSASVSSTVSCAVTLAATPGALSFGPQTIGATSAAQVITVAGTNGAQVTHVGTTGDFSQTNNCGAALYGNSCTIEVVFTPASEGTLNGTLVISSRSSSSPAEIVLHGTGTNAVPDGFSLVPLNNVDPSTVEVSNPITVAGTNVPTTISVSTGAEYSVNGGSYTSVPGVVSPGAQVTVRMTSASSYSTEVSAVLEIGGVSSTFVVTTRPQPLQDVTVTSGGGSLSPVLILALGAVLLLRIGRPRASLGVALIVSAGMLMSHRSMAADWDAGLSNVYVGGSLGEVSSTLTPGKVTERLQAAGYQIVATSVQKDGLSGSLYVGYELPRWFALEIAWSYLGKTRTRLEGIEPPALAQLLQDTSHVTRGSGDAWSLAARYRCTFSPKLSLDVRAGPYRWVTHSDLWLGSSEELSRNDRGWGYMLGVGPRYVLSEQWSLALNAGYFASTGDNRFVQVAASVAYRLR